MPPAGCFCFSCIIKGWQHNAQNNTASGFCIVRFSIKWGDTITQYFAYNTYCELQYLPKYCHWRVNTSSTFLFLYLLNKISRTVKFHYSILTPLLGSTVDNRNWIMNNKWQICGNSILNCETLTVTTGTLMLVRGTQLQKKIQVSVWSNFSFISCIIQNNNPMF